jgi:hypothetical protein
MLIPRRVKHRKQHHPSRKGATKGGSQVAFGDFGIQALAPAYVTNRQIEAARIAMTRSIKRGGKVWIYKGEVIESRTERAASALAAARAPKPERRGPRTPRAPRGEVTTSHVSDSAVATLEAPAAGTEGSEA